MTTVEKREAQTQVSGNAQADELLCIALRDEVAFWPERADPAFESVVLARAEYHGVAVLLNERTPQLPSWPQSLRQALRDSARAQACWDMRHGLAMGEAVEALIRRGIEPLFFKGTALAYGLYDDPAQRARADSDILVAPEAYDETAEALVTLGYERKAGTSYQESFFKRFDATGRHMIDLHRRVNNYEFLSQVVTYKELRAAARSLPRLHCDARAPSLPHAALLACLHRATHIAVPVYEERELVVGEDRLIWLYDLHLLARAFTPADWSAFVELASIKGLRKLSLEAFDRSEEAFRFILAAEARESLSVTGEAASRYLESSRLRRAFADVASVPGVRARLAFVARAAFPDPAAMRSRYGEMSTAALPWRYVRRAAAGVWHRLNPSHA